MCFLNGLLYLINLLLVESNLTRHRWSRCTLKFKFERLVFVLIEGVNLFSHFNFYVVVVVRRQATSSHLLLEGDALLALAEVLLPRWLRLGADI